MPNFCKHVPNEFVTKRCKKIHLCWPSIIYGTKFNKRVKIVQQYNAKVSEENQGALQEPLGGRIG